MTLRPTLVALAALFLLPSGAALADTPAGSLFGAKGTPDISGVWNVDQKRTKDWPKAPPFKPTYEKEFQRRVAAERAGKPVADPGARCLPHGLPSALMFAGYPIEIIQTPGRVTVIKENLNQTWRVWTDGRPHPKDWPAGFLGHAIGKWEGDTLVVDLVGLRDDTLLDMGRTMPHSTALHVVQRWRKLDDKTLELKMTADDAEALTKPIESTTVYTLRPDFEVLEQFCEAPGFAIDADGTIAAQPGAN